MAVRPFDAVSLAACKLPYYRVGMAATVCDRLFLGWSA